MPTEDLPSTSPGLTWRCVDPDPGPWYRVALGLAILSVALVAFLGSTGYLVFWLERQARASTRYVDVGVSPVIPLAGVALAIGLLVRSGLRFAYPRLRAVVPAILARAGLWLGILVCLMAGPRVLLELRRLDTAIAISVVLVTPLLFAVIVLQFWILLRLPEIRRSHDLNDGGLL
jgi:hypothetical protein